SISTMYFKVESLMRLLNFSDDISEANHGDYALIYIIVGHGVMFDYTDNSYILNAVIEIYDHVVIVTAVCHGISALLNVKNQEGKYFIENKSITGFSNTEEILANRKNNVPFMLETELKKRGANYSKAKLPFRPYVKQDKQLITG